MGLQSAICMKDRIFNDRCCKFHVSERLAERWNIRLIGYTTVAFIWGELIMVPWYCPRYKLLYACPSVFWALEMKKGVHYWAKADTSLIREYKGVHTVVHFCLKHPTHVWKGKLHCMLKQWLWGRMIMHPSLWHITAHKTPCLTDFHPWKKKKRKKKKKRR